MNVLVAYLFSKVLKGEMIMGQVMTLVVLHAYLLKEWCNTVCYRCVNDIL